MDGILEFISLKAINKLEKEDQELKCLLASEGGATDKVTLE